jgi:5-dehydro-4-deoxyglucarate dehydratase
MSQGWKERLSGVIGGPVSPFRADLSLDLAALESNVAGLAAFDFRGMLIAAGIGEFYSLTPDEVVESLRVSARAIDGRMPVIGTVGLNSDIAAEAARQLERAGADALLILPPAYANPPEEGLLRYYSRIAEASGLPLIVYSRDWCAFTPGAVARLAERIPALVAWKDGQGDIRRYQRIMQKVGDRLVWLGGVGDDCAPAYYAIGVTGFTSSLSNVLPKLALRMADAGRRRDLDELNRLTNRYVHPVFRLRDRMRGYEVAVTKAAMEMFGLPAGPVRPPLMGLRPPDVEELDKLVNLLAEMR